MAGSSCMAGGAGKVTGTGILVCGLNGAGKSTLGRALAEKLAYHFIDAEELYFPEADALYPYTSPRSREEVEKLLFHRIRAHGPFVFASVTGNFGEAFYPLLQCAVLLAVPREIRLQRVKRRSLEKFGSRMLPGGDLYQQEARFFSLVQSRPENTVEEWIQALSCPILRLDGTRPVAENIDYIIQQM